MNGLRIFLSVVSMLAIWFFVGVLGYFFILSRILQPTVIKNWIAADQGYEKITTAIKEGLASSEAGDEVTVKISNGLTPQLLQSQTETVVDKYFSYMKGDKTAMTLSSKEINDQLLKNLNISEAELPADMKQLVPELKLPMVDEKNFQRVNRFYLWVYLDQPYILGIIIFFLAIILLTGFSFRNKMVWWLWSAIPPFIMMFFAYLGSSFAKSYFQNSDSLFSSLSGPVKEVAYLKVKSLIVLLQSAELKVVLIELAVVAVFLLLYIIAGILDKPKTPVQPAQAPAQSSAPPAVPTQQS
jgi:hypothetical protein